MIRNIDQSEFIILVIGDIVGDTAADDIKLEGENEEEISDTEQHDNSDIVLTEKDIVCGTVGCSLPTWVTVEPWEFVNHPSVVIAVVAVAMVDEEDEE